MILGATTLAIVAAYALLAFISRRLSDVAGADGAFWLPAGLNLAVCVAFGRRAWPGVFLGELISELLGGSGLWHTSALLALGNLCSAAIITSVIPAKRSTSSLRLDRAYPLGSTAIYARATAGVLLGACANAVMGTAALRLWPDGVQLGSVMWMEMAEFAVTFFAADVGSAVALGPLLIALLARRRQDWVAPSSAGWDLVIAAAMGISIMQVLHVRQGDLWLVMALWACITGYLAYRLCLGHFTVYLTATYITAILQAPTIARLSFNGDLLAAMQSLQSLAIGFFGLALGVAVFRHRLEAGVAALAIANADLAQAKAALEHSNQQLLDSMALLNRTERALGIGSWTMDMRSHEVRWSDQLYRTFGLEPQTSKPDFDWAMRQVSPEDRAAVQAAWDQSLESGHYDHTHRVLVNGEVRWMRGQCQIERDGQGQPIRVTGTWHDVTEPLLAERLMRERDRAEAANQAKTHFLATLSHEIRTPLNGVVGMGELLRGDTLTAATRIAYAEQLVRSARLLNNIVSDVLDISKIEAGELNIREEPFSLKEMLHELRNGYQLLCDERGVEFHLWTSPELSDGWTGDAVRLRQVLHNLLSNAVKNTASGHVTLAATLTLGWLRLEVRDTGSGISEGELGRLFTPFTQLGERSRHQGGGTGLGLAIAQRLVEAMGGRIQVHSRLGSGSAFWFDLPLKPAPADIQLCEDPIASAPAVTLSGLRVLVAEDNPVNTLVVRKLLERAGVIVTCVVHGQEALDAIEATQPVQGGGEQPSTSPVLPRFDLVLMDIHMPVLDGLAACRQLRALEAASPDRARLPVLALSAGVMREQRQEALDAGMDGFISKPVQLDVLLREVGLHARGTLAVS